MSIKAKAVAHDAYELHDEFDQTIIGLTSIKDGDGTLRVTATVTGNIANDIVDGLRLLEVVRRSVAPKAYPAPAAPPAQPAPWTR